MIPTPEMSCFSRTNDGLSVVLVAPSIKVQHQLQGVPIGGQVSIKCRVEASPNTVHVWYKDGKSCSDQYLLLWAIIHHPSED